MSYDFHRRQDLRSLDLHREAVRVLEQHPEQERRVLEVLDRWEWMAGNDANPLFAEWRRIVEERLWELALEDSDRGQQLRQASPLGFALEPTVRDEIVSRWRSDVVGL